MSTRPFGLAELSAAVREADGRVLVTPAERRLIVYGSNDEVRADVDVSADAAGDLDRAADRAAWELVRQLPPYSRLLIAEAVA